MRHNLKQRGVKVKDLSAVAPLNGAGAADALGGDRPPASQTANSLCLLVSVTK